MVYIICGRKGENSVRQLPKNGEFYRHFKNKLYQIITVAKHSETGEQLVIYKLHGEGPVKRRIMDMGITKGVEIYVRKVAPLGDPMELTVRNYELSVRKADAEMIEVV